MTEFIAVAVLLLLLVAYHSVIGAFLATAFLFGTVGFWAVIVLEAAILTWFVEGDDDFGWPVASLSLVGLFVLFQTVSDVKPLAFIIGHPLLCVALVAGYLVIGGVWSVLKWWSVERERFESARETFYLGRAKTDPDAQEKYKAYMASMKTQPRNYKGRFLSWIGFWPFSLVLTFLNDPLRRAVLSIYRKLQGVYQRITDHVWAQ